MEEQYAAIFKEILIVSQETLALLKPIESIKKQDKSEIVARVKFVFKTAEHLYLKHKKENAE